MQTTKQPVKQILRATTRKFGKTKNGFPTHLLQTSDPKYLPARLHAMGVMFHQGYSVTEVSKALGMSIESVARRQRRHGFAKGWMNQPFRNEVVAK